MMIIINYHLTFRENILFQPHGPILKAAFFGGTSSNTTSCLRAFEQYVEPSEMDPLQADSPFVVVDAIDNSPQHNKQEAENTTPEVAVSTSPSTLSTRSPVPSDMEHDDQDDGKLVVVDKPAQQFVAQRFFDGEDYLIVQNFEGRRGQRLFVR